MIVNNIGDEDKSKLKRVITENTKPDTSNNLAAGNFGFNNLNSILKNVDEDRVVKYLKIPKTETAKSTVAKTTTTKKATTTATKKTTTKKAE